VCGQGDSERVFLRVPRNPLIPVDVGRAAVVIVANVAIVANFPCTFFVSFSQARRPLGCHRRSWAQKREEALLLLRELKEGHSGCVLRHNGLRRGTPGGMHVELGHEEVPLQLGMTGLRWGSSRSGHLGAGENGENKLGGLRSLGLLLQRHRRCRLAHIGLGAGPSGRLVVLLIGCDRGRGLPRLCLLVQVLLLLLSLGFQLCLLCLTALREHITVLATALPD